MSHLTRPASVDANDCSARRQGWARVRELTYVLACGIMGSAEGVRKRWERIQAVSNDNSKLMHHTAQAVVYPVRYEPVESPDALSKRSDRTRRVRRVWRPQA